MKRDEVTILKEKYEEASKSNPQYSLRAFAKRAGISSGGLSQILSRKKNLSLARAHEVARALKMTEIEKEEFLLAVQISSARSEASRSEFYEKYKTLHSSSVVNLELEQFKAISEWYGFAIIEMISTFASEWTPHKIAKFLGISHAQSLSMIERLIRIEVIEKTPKGYVRIQDRLIVDSMLPNEAMRKYYDQVFDHAKESVFHQTPQEKMIGTEVFAFDPKQIGEVRTLTNQYLDALLELAKKGESRTELYQVITDCFRLNPKEKRKK